MLVLCLLHCRHFQLQAVAVVAYDTTDVISYYVCLNDKHVLYIDRCFMEHLCPLLLRGRVEATVSVDYDAAIGNLMMVCNLPTVVYTSCFTPVLCVCTSQSTRYATPQIRACKTEAASSTESERNL